MGLTLNSNDARQADNFSSVIKQSGKYVGIITRAEKLISKNKVEGLGLSFKTDDGASANYLDIYAVKPNGEKLFGYSTIQAIMCCARVKTADEGQIQFEKWDKDTRKMVTVGGIGYPALMGKRIGLVLQQVLETHSVTGDDVEKLNIAGVFEASTGLTSSEILDGKTKPEKLEVLVKMITAHPVRDSRKKQQKQESYRNEPMTPAEDEFSDIPF